MIARLQPQSGQTGSRVPDVRIVASGVGVEAAAAAAAVVERTGVVRAGGRHHAPTRREVTQSVIRPRKLRQAHKRGHVALWRHAVGRRRTVPTHAAWLRPGPARQLKSTRNRQVNH